MRLADVWLQNFEQSWSRAGTEVEMLKANFKPAPWDAEIVPNQQGPLDGPVAPTCDWIEYQ